MEVAAKSHPPDGSVLSRGNALSKAFPNKAESRKSVHPTASLSMAGTAPSQKRGPRHSTACIFWGLDSEHGLLSETENQHQKCLACFVDLLEEGFGVLHAVFPSLISRAAPVTCPGNGLLLFEAFSHKPRKDRSRALPAIAAFKACCAVPRLSCEQR